ncbi:MAG: helix-turn-helix domain-containing protein [Richelia sp. RM2_1_2]|nr:helix-turn-helix domain-containing protein [Richelia sp. RM1_1_1]NJO63805.1 helix-turn-helix domain-containing protein [Richelia sp. RM2_1_2]
MTTRNLGAKLKQARENVGLTQSEAGRAISCGQSSLCKKECGNRSIFAWELIELAKLYNVDFTYFLSD